MYPITGSAATTRSPSSLTTSRSVPWVAGCWGPMLRIMSLDSSSTLMRVSARCFWMKASWWVSTELISALLALGAWLFAGHRLDVDEAGPRLDLAGEQRELLAQRKTLESGRQIQLPQRRMTVEHDPVH